MIARFSQKAEANFAAAFQHYHEVSPVLGRTFYRRTIQAHDLIAEWPNAGREVAPGIRKQNVRKFPYALLYRIEQDHIEIVRLVHLRGNPKNWKP